MENLVLMKVLNGRADLFQLSRRVFLLNFLWFLNEGEQRAFLHVLKNEIKVLFRTKIPV